MKRETTGSLLSTVFVDYDNIYLSLKRKNEEAAKRFAKNAGIWINAIASGELMTPTNGLPLTTPRRIVMNRCYGNPVPRRSVKDNATDMNSFPFVRHHYLRAGFEVIDCPPLTAQLKNSADIRMVMDVRDYLLHDTYFDEFIILSGDADFTPVLHRLRAHARRTVIYANDYTAAPYRAISDGEIREADLISLLMGNDTQATAPAGEAAARKSLPSTQMLIETRSAIIAEVKEAVRSSQNPVPLEALADRAVRILGHDKTVGTAWGGVGSFRDLLEGGLPKELKLSGEAPYYVFDTVRQQRSLPLAARLLATQRITAPIEAGAPDTAPAAQTPAPSPATVSHELGSALDQPAPARAPAPEPAPISRQHANSAPTVKPAGQNAQPGSLRQRIQPSNEIQPTPAPPAPSRSMIPADPVSQPAPPRARDPLPTAPSASPPAAAGRDRQPAPAPHSQPAPSSDQAAEVQRAIARIHEACQAPPLSPPEYKVLFDVMAGEIKTNGLTGARTLVNIVQAAQDVGVNLRRDDARFILEVVSEADPWFEQGASAQLFASRFRNFVVARCRGQGMNLSADELDLIDAWFSGVGLSASQVTASNDVRSSGVGAQGGSAPAPRQPAAHGVDPITQNRHAPQQPAGQPRTAASGQVPQGQASSTSALGDIIPATTGGGSDPFGGAQAGHGIDDEEFPRVIRSLARG